MSFTVRSVDQAFADAVAWHLAPFRRERPEVQAFPVDMYVQETDQAHEPPEYSLFIANALRYRHHRLRDVLHHTIWALHADVSKRVRDFVLLHAGAVVGRGGAMLIPGRSGSGKSSLVLALLQQGFSYLSDELGAIDPITARAYAFEKRISLEEAAVGSSPALAGRLEDRQGSLILPDRYVSPENVDAAVAGPAPITRLVFIGEDRTGEPRLSGIGAGMAVERMAEHAVNLFRYQERGVILLTRIAENAEAYELQGGTARSRAELLAERFA